MSTFSDPQADFDLWDIVCCAKCLLPFLQKSGPTIPFWLTECGHILCNIHLSPNQSCSQCGAQGIQLIPLQKEMEAPMSEWFRPIPSMLDMVAYSVKFQQEIMTAQILSLRSRCQQQRMVIDRLKAENLELKKINGELKNGNSQNHPRFDSAEDDDQRPSDVVNMNGKRPWNDSHQIDERAPKLGSSSNPRYLMNPAGPDRFTFPRHQVPRNTFHDCNTFEFDAYNSAQDTKIISDQLTKRYAYKVPPTSALQSKAPLLSNAQAATPTYQHRTQYAHDPGQVGTPLARNVQQGFATHPRPQSRFKPAKITHDTVNQTMDLASSSKFQRVTDQEVKRLRSMGPPPTPQHLRQQRETEMGANNNIPAITTDRFLTSSNGNTATAPTASNRRFIPPSTPLNGNTRRPSNTATNTNISDRTANTRRGNMP